MGPEGRPGAAGLDRLEEYTPQVGDLFVDHGGSALGTRSMVRCVRLEHVEPRGVSTKSWYVSVDGYVTGVRHSGMLMSTLMSGIKSGRYELQE